MGLCKFLYCEGKQNIYGKNSATKTKMYGVGNLPAAWAWGVGGTRGHLGSEGPASVTDTETSTPSRPHMGPKTVPERVRVGNDKAALKSWTLNRKLRPSWIPSRGPHPRHHNAHSLGGQDTGMSFPLVGSAREGSPGKMLCPVYILFWFLVPAQSLGNPQSRPPGEGREPRRKRSPCARTVPAACALGSCQPQSQRGEGSCL